MKKNKKENILGEIEVFLNKHKISGIIRIPGIGVFSKYVTIPDRLIVLDQARIELMIRDRELQNEVYTRCGQPSKLNDENEIVSPSYVG